jgi:hypothetical protein
LCCFGVMLLSTLASITSIGGISLDFAGVTMLAMSWVWLGWGWFRFISYPHPAHALLNKVTLTISTLIVASVTAYHAYYSACGTM